MQKFQNMSQVWISTVQKDSSGAEELRHASKQIVLKVQEGLILMNVTVARHGTCHLELVTILIDQAMQWRVLMQGSYVLGKGQAAEQQKAATMTTIAQLDIYAISQQMNARN
jgi:hypothetical protein